MLTDMRMLADTAGAVKKNLTVWEFVARYIIDLLRRNSKFTGKLEINFKDGKLMDINCTTRTKYGKD